ncbi:deletion of SUV3 suppressor 1(I) [Actinidia rufa]|uniref:26S proteasome complex subunit SEM1 n=1 Tax=Actinidia rufa TaxID=165716 RepID=A0A7J0GMX7_9ERIC|nr:deletion of SUV3 suppressor 1(I) [Actinidia rufa]
MATEPKAATEDAKMDLFEDDDEFEEFEINQERFTYVIPNFSSTNFPFLGLKRFVFQMLLPYTKGDSAISGYYELVFYLTGHKLQCLVILFLCTDGLLEDICNVINYSHICPFSNTVEAAKLVLLHFLYLVDYDAKLYSLYFLTRLYLFSKMMAMAEWEVKEEGQEITQQWEDDWDDDDVNDDFSLQLRRELENNTEKN